MAKEEIEVKVSASDAKTNNNLEQLSKEAAALQLTLRTLKDEAKRLSSQLNAKRTGFSIAQFGREGAKAGIRNSKGGLVTPQNLARAISQHLKQQGNVEFLKTWSVNDKQFANAYEWYQKTIETGHVAAQEYKANLAAQQITADKLKIVADKIEVETGTPSVVVPPTTPDTPSPSPSTDETETISPEEITPEKASQQINSLSKIIKSFALYRLAVVAVRKALHSAVATITELDKSLTEQAMVTGKTRQETYALLSTYQELAFQLGSTTKEVAEIATQYIRQGKTTAEAITLTNAAISAAKVAGISASDSVNYLTTALNGFRMSAQDAMKVSDKFAAIAANSATSYDEIATALSKVASQANLAGMSIDYTTAVLAKGLETTREAPETMGTALKTIIARMRELSDYGETLSGDTDINNVESQLAYVGIALRDMNGELRSTEDVLDDLGKKWDTLTSNQQAAVAKALAGTRQQARLIAMMTDYERVLELQQISQRSVGATAAQMATYVEGLAAASNKVSVAWESIVTQLGKADSIIGVVDFLSQVLDGIANNIGFAHATLVVIVALSTILLGIRITEWIVEQAKTAEKNKQLAAEKLANQEAIKGLAISLATLSYWVLIGAAIAAVALLIGALIIGFTNQQSAVAKTTEEVSKLSAQIYNLENTVSSLKTITNEFDNLDNKVIQTREDIAQMSSVLDKALDSLSFDKANNVIQGLGMSERDYYQSLSTDKERRAFLTRVMDAYAQEAKTKRQAQLNKLNLLSAADLTQALELESNRDAIYALNNSKLYEFIDLLEQETSLTKEESIAVEQLTQSMLEQLDARSALEYANNPDKIRSLVSALNSLDRIDGNTVAQILTSDDYSIKSKVDAYATAINNLDAESQQLLKTIYTGIDAFAQFSDEVLEFIDTNTISIKGLNDIGNAIQALGYTTEEAQTKIEALFASIASGTQLEAAIRETFGSLTDEEYAKFLNTYASILGTGILNMGQNIQNLKNTVNSFYETAMKWNELNDSDKTAFLADNAELFAGESGKRLLEAMKSGDYNIMQAALSDPQGTLVKKVQQQIKDIDTEIQLEYAKLEQDRDYAYIQYLEDQKQVLMDSTNLYAASLDVRLAQEKKYLDEYKSYLSDQQKALQESLEKRKNAYQDYFESINQEAKDEDFEEKENTLIANISKLATSGSADAVNQQAKLEQELAQLEKERLDELRQRAQEAIMENMDQTLEDINKKFDELLNSQQALLAAMTGELDNPTAFLSNLISNKIAQEGLTELGLQSYLRDLQATYGSVLGNDIFDNMSVEKQGDQLILNIAGTEVVLSDNDQQSVYTAIMTALQQVGLR